MDRAVNDEKNAFEGLFHNIPFLGWFWILFLSIWGSLANYIIGIKEGRHVFSWRDLFLDFIVSSFSGILVAYVCVGLGLSEWFVYAASGMAGHQGSRGLRVVWSITEKRLKKL